MYNFPVSYHQPLFRPPSEGRSLIVQVTYGCSWNQCAFCEMYSSTQFKARGISDIFTDIEAFLPYRLVIRRVFLADGDPMVLSTAKLLKILNKLKESFPKLNRISTYASPSNLNKKSEQELTELKDAGLSLVYVGIESGNNEVLKLMNKGETFKSTVEALNQSKKAGINSSVMIINGLGGKIYSQQHAVESAKILNETQPKYASTLVLNTYKGFEHFLKRLQKPFTVLYQKELLEEMYLFLETLDLKETIFRSDHASNYLVLKGVLGRDKQQFLHQIHQILDSGDFSKLRQERQRGF